MKAAVCYGSDQPFVIEDRPDPVPGPDDIVIRVRRCGVCGSELHLNDGPPRAFPGGFVIGHEFTGEIVEIGTAVTGFRKGDRVAAVPVKGCGRCEACHQGNYILCPQAVPLMGGFAEYMTVPASVAVKLPDNLSFADGALIEPLTVSLYGVRVSRIQPGDRVLVLGAGTIALGVIYWARRLGADRIVAMSRSDRRAEMALAMGADAFVAYGDSELDEAVEALGGPADVVYECVGSPGFLSKSVQHARLYGQVISLGFCMSPDQIVPSQVSIKGVTLQFPAGYSLNDFRYVAHAMNAGHVDPKMMISSVIPLDAFPDMFARLQGPNNETKVHVAPVPD
jgi:(R,R)-butanediol dehydrogenase/meso-butanediol dehydrogenase/diacetyl reductase